ncbi:unnamed protein product [Alopecurus aequalis]
MASDTNNLALHIRRLVRSSIRLAYHCAYDHSEVLAAAIVLLLLHGLCPTLFAFMLSSSPVIALTALLLGAILSCGEATVALDREETPEEHGFFRHKTNIYISDCLVKKAEDVAVRAHLEKRTENASGEVYVRERGSDDCTSNAPCEDKNVAYIASDAAVLSGGADAEEDRIPDDNLHGTHFEEKNVTSVEADSVLSAEPGNNTKINVTLECEEHTKEIDEKAELQDLESTCTGSCNSGVHSQYQFGEFMRSCWQPVIRPEQDLPCSDSDSESDLTFESSSPDASMTDIIPMLEDLHPLVNIGAGQLSLASRDNLDSSSEDNEDDLEEEEEDVSSDDEEGTELQQDGENNWKDVVHINCFDMDQNGKFENLMELQRAKNILKFELDMRSIDLQASDATRKLKDASSFHVQAPSISTPRYNPFDPEISRIPGSAPSALLPWRNMFDLRLDRVVDHRSLFEETWSPRSRIRSAQNMKQRNSYGQNHSTCLQHHNGEIGDSHSDDDAEREGNNIKLFGSLEAHLSEEMKILSAAISDVGMLGEVNHGTEEGNKTTNDRDHTSSLSGVNNYEIHVMEADTMSEVNSLFKCRMEEVLVQSISECSVCQPLEVKPEDIPSVSLSSDSWMHVNGTSSDEDLNFQFGRLDEEARSCAASDLNGHGDSIRDRSSEALRVVDEQNSELPIGLDGCWELSTADISEPNKPVAAYADLPILEASSVEEMNPLFEQLEEAVQLSNGRSKINIPQDRLRELNPVELNSRSRVTDAETMNGASGSGLNATGFNRSAGQAEATAVAGQATQGL